jgi:5-methylcytosine-specific restriction protein A
MLCRERLSPAAGPCSAEHKAWALRVKQRAGWRCEDCGRAGTQLYADHVVELQYGGDRLGKGRALCPSCHTLKTNRERTKRFSA